LSTSGPFICPTGTISARRTWANKNFRKNYLSACNGGGQWYKIPVPVGYVAEKTLQTPFFFGEHELTLDAKNRLLIPSQVRKNIDPETDGTSFFVTLKGSIPWFYPRGFYRQLLNLQIGPDLTPSEQLMNYTHLKLSLADELEWDSQGRVVLTERILTRAKLGKEIRDVMLVGSKDHLELWQRDKWIEHRDKLIADSQAIEEWAQKTLRQPPPEKQKEA
jgi:MraZ protein